MSKDPWDQFTFLWYHSDKYLVRDAHQIVNSDDSEFLKIGKLQLLVSEWEAKNLSTIPRPSKLKRNKKNKKPKHGNLEND